MNKYYVYIWYIKKNNEIFYVGKGCNGRYKSLRGRNPYFLNIINKYETDSLILKDNLSEKDALSLEEILICYFKSLGLARANLASGGSGSNSFLYKSEKEKEIFRKKMTIINKERCQSPKFKKEKSEYMHKKYESQSERKKQSETLKKSWANIELRKRQSEIIKNSYDDRLRNIRKIAGQKQIELTINDKVIVFESRKALLAYLKATFNYVPSNHTLKKLLNGTPLHTKTKFKHLEGLKIKYI